MNRSLEEGSTAVSSRRRRLGRSVFILPSLFTVGNIFCGYYAIISTMHGQFDQAAKAIGIAIVLDMLDGRIARMTNSTSGFGLQLDSLADVISFGIAPSILVMQWGLTGVNGRLSWIAAFTFAICGAMRLARFNVQASSLKHFVGMPIPAAGGTIAAVVHFYPLPLSSALPSGMVAGGVFLLAFLMISTVRYSSLKNLTLGRKSHFTILGIALLVALIYNYSRWTLLVIATCYAGSGPVGRIVHFLKHRRAADSPQLGDAVEGR